MDGRRRYSAIALCYRRKPVESSNKRSRKEIEDPNPAVIVSQVSKATMTEH